MRRYSGRYFIRKRVWRCGDYIEAETYPVFQKQGMRRAKCNPTREAQRRLNQRDAERRLTRIMHLNFTEKDYELDLTFAEVISETDAMRELENYIKRLRRIYRKAGIELRYLYTIEVGKRSGRTHIHMTITGGIDRDVLEQCWGNGYANTRRLQFDEGGLAGLAKYICKEGRPDAETEKRTYRRWSGSRNLKKPVPEVTDGEVTVQDVAEAVEAIERRDAAEDVRREWPGYELVEATAIRNAVNRGLYVSMSMCRRERWRRMPSATYCVSELGWEEEIA